MPGKRGPDKKPRRRTSEEGRARRSKEYKLYLGRVLSQAEDRRKSVQRFTEWAAKRRAQWAVVKSPQDATPANPPAQAVLLPPPQDC